MRWKKTLQLIDVHCEGEIGKVITSGVIDIPGATMLDKMNYINEVDDSLRRLVTLEPRGCLQMSVNLLLPPTVPGAHAGFIVLQADKAHPMSGSNCICVVTALLETGMVAMQEPDAGYARRAGHGGRELRRWALFKRLARYGAGLR